MNATHMIERLRSLMEKATAGEWRITGVMTGHKGDIYSPTAERIPDCHHIARCFAPKPEKSPACSLQVIGMTHDAVAQIEANAALIVEAINALPSLLSHIDALEARVAEVSNSLCDARDKAALYVRQRDEAVEAFRAAEHLCDRLRNIAAGKPVRDLEEAEAAFASARAFLAKKGETK